MAGYETAALELLALLWVLGLRWRYTQDRREWREMLAALRPTGRGCEHGDLDRPGRADDPGGGSGDSVVVVHPRAECSSIWRSKRGSSASIGTSSHCEEGGQATVDSP